MEVYQYTLTGAVDISAVAQQLLNLRMIGANTVAVASFEVQSNHMVVIFCVQELTQCDGMSIRQGNGLAQLNQFQIQPPQHVGDRSFGGRLQQIVLRIDHVALSGKFVAAGAKYQLYIFIGFPDSLGNIYAEHATHKNIQNDNIIASGRPVFKERLTAAKSVYLMGCVGNKYMKFGTDQIVQ